MTPQLKKRFIILFEQLNALRKNPSDCDTLYRMQLSLIVLIRRTERVILTTKNSVFALKREKKNRRLGKAESKDLKNRINNAEAILSDLRQQLIGWRYFGDAIAHIYHDKYALKHTYYNVDKYEVKQSAGFLSDKEGLNSELLVLKAAVHKNIPVLLCDLTNIIRHGDICVLVDNDPVLIEVKSSENTGARVKRQADALAKLQTFFETDQTENYHGRLKQSRVETISNEISHISSMDNCIEDALNNELGFSFSCPEEGLTYIVVDHTRSNELTPSIYFREAEFVCNLITGMRDAAWCPLSPCFLSFHSAEHAYLFATGHLVILVAVDPNALVQRFKEFGLAVRFVKHDTAVMLVSRIGDKTATYSGVPHLNFRRLFYEFDSIHDLIRMELWMLEFLESDENFNQACFEQNGILPNDAEVASLDFKDVELKGAPYIFV